MNIVLDELKQKLHAKGALDVVEKTACAVEQLQAERDALLDAVRKYQAVNWRLKTVKDAIDDVLAAEGSVFIRLTCDRLKTVLHTEKVVQR